MNKFHYAEEYAWMDKVVAVEDYFLDRALEEYRNFLERVRGLDVGDRDLLIADDMYIVHDLITEQIIGKQMLVNGAVVRFEIYRDIDGNGEFVATFDETKEPKYGNQYEVTWTDAVTKSVSIFASSPQEAQLLWEAGDYDPELVEIDDVDLLPERLGGGVDVN